MVMGQNIDDMAPEPPNMTSDSAQSRAEAVLAKLQGAYDYPVWADDWVKKSLVSFIANALREAEARVWERVITYCEEDRVMLRQQVATARAALEGAAKHMDARCSCFVEPYSPCYWGKHVRQWCSGSAYDSAPY